MCPIRDIRQILFSKQRGEDRAEKQAKASFGGDTENMPTMTISKDAESVIDVLTLTNICKSRGEARRLIEGGGVSVNDTKVTADNISLSSLISGTEFVLHKGKKVHYKIILE